MRAGGSLLRLSDGSYQACIVARNTTNRVLAMDLEGFFDHAFLAFFKANSDGEHRLSSRHTVLDIAVVPPGSGKTGALRAEWGFIRRALQLIRRRRVVAIQANDPYMTGLNALLLSRVTGLPYVIEIVDAYDISQAAGGYRYIPYFRSRSVEKRIEQTVLRNAHAVYAQNECYLRYALANGARRRRTFRVRCVTDAFHYAATPRKPMSAYVDTQNRKTLFYFGGLRACKNVLDLVPCLARVRGAGEDALLLVAGDGPQRHDMEQQAKQLGVRQALVFLGHRTAQELVDLMHGADVLLATHAGYALLEMALSSRPIVAYNYEWHPEVIHHEQTGLLAKFRDSDDMAFQALRLLRDPAMAHLFGLAARRYVIEHHDASDAIQDERLMYQQILKV